MAKRSTINDIAKACGISIGTVDRVLHNRGRCSAETRKLVLETAKALHYIPKHPDATAHRSLTHYRIGILVAADTQAGSFWATSVKGIRQAEDMLNRTNLDVEIVYGCQSSFVLEDQIQAINDLLAQNIDALIFTAFDEGSSFNFDSIIPQSVPYATVINRSWNDSVLFHIGPHDEQLGAVMAREVALYCSPDAKVAIIAPNIEIEGMTKRIRGFAGKVQRELKDMHILQISPVMAPSPSESYSQVETEVRNLLKLHSDLDAIYITNGFIKNACDAIRSIPGCRVKLFGHEVYADMERDLNDGILAATVYMRPDIQWFNAIDAMAKYLTEGTVPPHDIPAACQLVTQEMFPLL